MLDNLIGMIGQEVGSFLGSVFHGIKNLYSSFYSGLFNSAFPGVSLSFNLIKWVFIGIIAYFLLKKLRVIK